jgi:parallel beta-helix repeat protein
MKRTTSGIMLTLLLTSILCVTIDVKPAASWSNGGFSDDPSSPDYGTHDWIAQHALDWLPQQEKQYILDNLASYLYGTELPDNGGASDGIGDTVNHHVYYWANGSLQDDASAIRAQTEYDEALNYIETDNLAMAAKTLGIMSHYIVDVAVFGHVMGLETYWGSEIHHSDYEAYVEERTNNYTDEFNTYLVFDGSLSFISAYDATCALAFDTTFDVDGSLTCVWMDQNYNWSNPTFKNRCGESLNLAVNYLADVLHTIYLESALPIHNIDTGLDYATIQGAIDASETLDGHTILVDAGTYYEHVNLNKSIALIGEDRSTTIIDGGGTGTVVSVIANDTMITGFTMRDSGEKFVEGEPAIWCGIMAGGYETLVVNTTIIDNTINNNYFGVFLWTSMNATLIDSSIENNTKGICLLGILSNNIQHNTVLNNNGGINAQYVLQSDISDNTITSNVLAGLTMQDSSSNRIDGNHIENNGYGIDLSACDSNNITRNTLINNNMGISLGSSSSNSIYNNNFICNTKQVINVNSNNTWNDVYPSGGNYWSDYTGADLYKGPYQNNTGSDGIGDTPYVVDVYNKDKYPLMYPPEITLYVAPSPVEFWTPAHSKTFTVDVKIANVAKLYGFEFKLYWNTSLLDLVNVTVTPPSAWGTNYFIGMNETREDLGRYWLAVAALNPASLFNGSATLVKLTFKITYDPIYPNNVTSSLDLAGTQLSDSEANAITHLVYDGEYWCYATEPRLESKPSTYTAKTLGEKFTINITISDVVNLYSFEFQLIYNTTLLDATAVNVGGFLNPPYSITKQIIDDAAGFIWLSVQAQSPAPSTNGSGTLATVTFMVPTESGIWYKGFLPLECDLHVNSTMLKTDQGVTVPNDVADPLLHYMYSPIPGDLNSDGIVNIFDLRIVARVFGLNSSEPNWDPRADLNHDNKVDIFDLVLVAKNYGRTMP